MPDPSEGPMSLPSASARSDVKLRCDIVVVPSPLDVASDIIKKRFKDVELMELLAHLSKAIHGHVSVLPVAICLITICTVAIRRVTQWVLHALVVGVANGERVNQANNQLIVGRPLLLDELNVGGGLWDEAEEGLCVNFYGSVLWWR